MAFIGDGADRSEIMEYAEKQGIADSCIFTGAIHDRALLKVWYSRANLFIFPSVFDTNGIVVREAAACGLPSLLIKGSCAAEGVTDGQNGILAEENSDAIAQKLMFFAADCEKLRQIGENAMNELYISWEESVANAHERYLTVLDNFDVKSITHRTKPADSAYALLAGVYNSVEKIQQLGIEQLDHINAGIAKLKELPNNISDKLNK